MPHFAHADGFRCLQCRGGITSAFPERLLYSEFAVILGQSTHIHPCPQRLRARSLASPVLVAGTTGCVMVFVPTTYLQGQSPHLNGSYASPHALPTHSLSVWACKGSGSGRPPLLGSLLTCPYCSAPTKRNHPQSRKVGKNEIIQESVPCPGSGGLRRGCSLWGGGPAGTNPP